LLDPVAVLVTEFFRHEVHGINVLAQRLPRFVFNSNVEEPAPPIVNIVNDRESPSMADKLDPPKLPAFALWVDSTARIEAKGNPQNKTSIVKLAGAYCTPYGADPIASRQACGYILSAGWLCMDRFSSTTVAEAPGEPSYRQLNGYRILEVASCEMAQRTATSPGRKTKMWGFLDIEVVVATALRKALLSNP
jgi:hypothetical protein